MGEACARGSSGHYGHSRSPAHLPSFAGVEGAARS